ncbi:MAG: hypothetical protein ABW096_01355 [Candidatus Thiodiazotropha sp.]
MTDEQKSLIRYWIFGGSILLIAICTTLLDIEHQQLALVGVSALFGLVSLFQDFSYYKGYGSGRKMLGEFIESHPKLKIYLVAYSVAVLPFLIYQMQSNSNHSGLLYFLSICGLFGPVVYFSELERFKSMGNINA